MDSDLRRLHFEKLINNNTAGEAFALKKENFPKKLYKYCSLDCNIFEQINLEKDIQSRTMNNYYNLLFDMWYLSQANTFDDVFDCDICINNFNFDLKEEKQKIRIICFTESNNNELMWSLYSSRHMGFCIEYDMEEMDIDFRGMFFPVYYSDYKYNMNADESPNYNNFYAMYSKKNEIWDWQSEWRVIIHQKEYNIIKIKGSEVINAFAPISAIYLGMRVSDENERVFKDFCYKHEIKLFKAIKKQGSEYNSIDFTELKTCRFHKNAEN